MRQTCDNRSTTARAAGESSRARVARLVLDNIAHGAGWQRGTYFCPRSPEATALMSCRDLREYDTRRLAWPVGQRMRMCRLSSPGCRPRRAPLPPAFRLTGQWTVWGICVLGARCCLGMMALTGRRELHRVMLGKGQAAGRMPSPFGSAGGNDGREGISALSCVVARPFGVPTAHSCSNLACSHGTVHFFLTMASTRG